MLSNFALMILNDNRKKNYIIKNKDKLNEEEIVKIINSSKKRIAIFDSLDLSNLNISNNTFFNLLSELENDETKMYLYAPDLFGDRKFDLKECDDNIIIKFINSFKNDEDKLKYKGVFKRRNEVFVDVLNHVDNKIDFISQISYSLSDFLRYLSDLQNQLHIYGDEEIINVIIKYINTNNIKDDDDAFKVSNWRYSYSIEPSQIIYFTNKLIANDENKIKFLKELDLIDKLEMDDYLCLLVTAKDYHNMDLFIKMLKDKYNNLDLIVKVLRRVKNVELKKYLYQNVYSTEILNVFNSYQYENKNQIERFKSCFDSSTEKDDFYDFFISNCDKKKLFANVIYDLFYSKELQYKYLIESLKIRNNLHSNIEVFLLLLDPKYKNSVIWLNEYSFLEEITDLDKYLTKGELEFYFQKLFNEYKWDLIFKMLTKEQISNYFLSDLDKCLLLKYFEIDDPISKKHFINYIKKNRDRIEIKHINNIVELIMRISRSNSTEIQHMRDSIIPMLLETNNPFENLKYIEDIFIKNNLPMPAKLYLVFDKLHPNCSGFNFNGNVSPTLKSKSVRGRQAVIFSDLLKASLGSNNRSIKEYLDNIYNGNILFKAINMNLRSIDELSLEEKEILTIFISHLNTLYNNTLDSNINGKRNLTGNLLQDIKELNGLFTKNGEIQKDLPDRIVRMFGYMAGFNSYQEMIDYMNERCKNANLKNRDNSNEFRLEKGDFIKGIGDVKYLGQILQNGSVAKEFLGDSAGSDATPLDTDLSQIQIDGTLTEMISSTQANSYGPIYFVLKNDGKFNITRTEDGDIPENIRDLSKLEIFYTGALGKGHYGIRTGFASSDIDYILCDNYDKRIALEIAMNGFYIPIIEKNTGKLLFSPNDYDILRGKMMGLTHYDTSNYQFSSNLENPLVNEMLTNIDENEQEVNRKRNIIIQNINASLAELGLKVKTEIDGDITPGSVELIDTGSTGRKTNMPGDGDFDFIMRLDQNIIISGEKLNQLKNKIGEGLSVGNGGTIGTGDFRLKNVNINGLDVPVDIDITFITKTNKMSYSTDMCLKDRLETIRKQNPEKYPYVIANIQLAKKILKQFECYKPNRGDKPQGGLGGVGVENWILQNDGSFYDACIDFLEKSRDKTFGQFKEEYQIWDFGENHLAEKKGYYSHDNFVTNNMSEDGYNKMKQALMTFVNNYTAMEEQNLSR